MDKGAPPDGYSHYPQLPQYDTTSGQPYGAPSGDKYGAPPANQGYVGPYGNPQQPSIQYGQPYVQQPQYGQQVVTVPAAGQTVIIQQPVARPPNYLWLSCLVYWCCNFIAGGIAFALSMASSSAADENRMDEARNYGRAAMWTSVVGVVLDVITIILIIVLYVTLWNETVDKIHKSYYNSYSSG